MSKFLGVSLFGSASGKGCAWEHGPGTKRSEKAFRKRRFLSKFLGVFLSEDRKERTWEHKVRTT